jgi:prepilin-type processing-associated H-X9-DG protein
MMSGHRRNALRATCVLLLGIWVGGANAAPVDLTQVAPEDTLIYLGWGGNEDVHAARAKTAWGKLLADPQVDNLMARSWSAVDTLLHQQAALEGAAEPYEMLKRSVIALVQQPTAIAVIDFAVTPEGPAPQLALISYAGDKKGANLLRDFQQILSVAQLPPAAPHEIGGKTVYQLPLPVPGGAFYGLVDGYFFIALGEQTVTGMINELSTKGATSLAKGDELSLARRKIGGTAETRAATVFVNAKGVWEIVQMLMPMITEGDAAEAKEIQDVVRLIGLDRVSSVCWEMHYRKNGCHQSLYMHYPQGRKGLLAWQSQKKLTKAELACIPASVTMATALKTDLNQLLQNFVSSIQTIEPNAGNDLLEGIESAERELGIQFSSEIPKAVGNTIIIYNAPDTGAFSLLNWTFVLPEGDVGRLRTLMKRAVDIVNREEPDVHLDVRDVAHGKATVSYVNITGVPLPFAPAWAEVDGDLVVAAFPQLVMEAIDYRSSAQPDKALIHTTDFELGVEAVGGLGSNFVYTDTRSSVEDLYRLLLPAAQALVAMGQKEGIQLDITTLPTASALTRHLFGSVYVERNDAEGCLLTMYGPMPGSIPAIGDAGTAQTAMMVSILLPSLSRARHLSKRVISTSNLKGIVTSCHIWAMENDGLFPPDLDTLLNEGYFTREQMTAPLDEDPSRPSYIYIPGQSENCHYRNILLYERPDINGGEGVNVAYVDGSVFFIPMAQFERELEETMERIGD